MTNLLIQRALGRTTVTPNATMVTLASPATTGAQNLSMWSTSMRANTSGPLHRFDTGQIWTLLTGTATITIEETPTRLDQGDTLTIPANTVRIVLAETDCMFIVCGAATTSVHVVGEDRPRSTPEWIV